MTSFYYRHWSWSLMAVSDRWRRMPRGYYLAAQRRRDDVADRLHWPQVWEMRRPEPRRRYWRMAR